MRIDGTTAYLHVWDASSVWTGEHVYVFGGNWPYSEGYGRKLIVRIDPATGEHPIMDARFARDAAGTAAVWTGTHALVFGDGTDAIHRYDPAADNLTEASARLPSRLIGAAAVWTGTHAYVFGGHDLDTSRGSSRIVRYDPVADETTVVAATLIEGLEDLTAVWSGDHALVVGGRDRFGDATRGVWRFDPASESLERVASLPISVFGAAAFSSGADVFVLGGNGAWDGARYPRLDTIQRVVPTTWAGMLMPTPLPNDLAQSTAQWTGDSALLVGGLGGDFALDAARRILRIDVPACLNFAPVAASPPAADGFHDGSFGWTDHEYAFSAVDAFSDPEGDPFAVTWTFGASTTAAGSVVTHAFAAAGAHAVDATALDDPSARPGCGSGAAHSGRAPTLTFTGVGDWGASLVRPLPPQHCVKDRTVPAFFVPAMALECRVEGRVQTREAPADAVRAAEFRLDGAAFASDATAPYSGMYDSLRHAPGFHELRACFHATDDKYARTFCSGPHRFLNVGADLR